MPLILFLLAEYGHGKSKTYPEQNNHADFLVFTSEQKKIKRLLAKDVFKIIISNKIVTPEEISNSTPGLNSCFLNDIKDLYIDKA